MAKFTCGDKSYSIPLMSFFAVERAWPFVREATETFDPMKGTSAAIGVVASGLMDSEDFSREEWGISDVASETEAFEKLMYTIKKRLKMNEIGNAKVSMFEILEEGGLQVSEGELLSALEEALQSRSLQETVPDTSPNSSQPV